MTTKEELDQIKIAVMKNCYECSVDFCSAQDTCRLWKWSPFNNKNARFLKRTDSERKIHLKSKNLGEIRPTKAATRMYCQICGGLFSRSDVLRLTMCQGCLKNGKVAVLVQKKNETTHS